MARTGEILKKSLGLENLKSVKISRIALSSYPILMVWYNSYRPKMPITRFSIKHWPYTAMIFHGTDLYHGTDKVPAMTPPMDIEEYNGLLRGTLVIPVDMSGYKFIDDKKLTRKFESSETEVKNIPQWLIHLDEFTVYDLADSGNISNFTSTWRKDRNRVMGGGASKNTKLIDCIVDEGDGSVTFQFLTEATELGTAQPSKTIDSPYRFYQGDKQEVDPNNLRLKRNTGKVYELQIKVLNALEWIKAFEGEKLSKKEMKQILEASDVQIFSTSPSFQMQGFNYWNSQLDTSIHPENRKPQRWDKYHGDGQAFLDKHLYSLFTGISFFLNQMAQMLQKKLRQRGLL